MKISRSRISNEIAYASNIAVRFLEDQFDLKLFPSWRNGIEDLNQKRLVGISAWSVKGRSGRIRACLCAEIESEKQTNDERSQQNQISGSQSQRMQIVDHPLPYVAAQSGFVLRCAFQSHFIQSSL